MIQVGRSSVARVAAGSAQAAPPLLIIRVIHRPVVHIAAVREVCSVSPVGRVVIDGTVIEVRCCAVAGTINAGLLPVSKQQGRCVRDCKVGT